MLKLASDHGVVSDAGIPADSPLAIRGLTVSYGQKPAVFSVDMTVEMAQIAALSLASKKIKMRRL